MAMRTVRSKTVLKKVFDSVARRFADRPGGYTRIIKLGRRAGDGAPLSIIELLPEPGAEKAAKAAKAAGKEKKAPAKGKASAGASRGKTGEGAREEKTAKAPRPEKKRGSAWRGVGQGGGRRGLSHRGSNQGANEDPSAREPRDPGGRLFSQGRSSGSRRPGGFLPWRPERL
jgi:hypothetical protein